MAKAGRAMIKINDQKVFSRQFYAKVRNHYYRNHNFWYIYGLFIDLYSIESNLPDNLISHQK